MFHKNIILAAQRSHHDTDANNNNNNAISFPTKSSEKYSLRQRHKRPIVDDRSGDDSVEGGYNVGNDAQHIIAIKRSAPSAAKQSARSAPSGHVVASAPKSISSTVSSAKATKKKAKPKAAPLSKYRRKTANARERTRMREINSAFENLRKFVPLSFGGETPASTNEKLTKITTLRLAMKYIQSLNDVLHCGGVVSDAESSTSSSSSSSQSPLSSSASSDAASDSDASSDGSTTAAGCERRTSAAAPVVVEPSDIGYGLTLNEESKDLFKDLLMTAYGTTDTLRLGLMPRNSSPAKDRRFGEHLSSAAFHGKSFNPADDATNTIMFNQHQPGLSASSMLHDIGLMFESDGESLHLSEPCLSPPSSFNPHHRQHQHPPHLNAHMHAHHPHHHLPNNINMMATDAMGCPTTAANSAHDLSVLLAESDNDSLELSEPCLSPLAGLDVLGPFGDLLMHSTDFGAEHQHLEMYLT